MKVRCRITTIVARSGRMKCSEKNRFRVGKETENPPQSHITTVLPRYGTAEKMFVITVAPQNDICPHGRTYPRKAVAINMESRVIPLTHGIFFFDLDLK